MNKTKKQTKRQKKATPTKDITPQQQNNQLVINLNQQNYTITARGHRYYNVHEIDGEPVYTFGYQQLQYWNPTTKQWTPLPDQFYVSGPDRETLPTEFFARWKIYIQKKFKRNFVKIETLSTIKEN